MIPQGFAQQQQANPWAKAMAAANGNGMNFNRGLANRFQAPPQVIQQPPTMTPEQAQQFINQNPGHPWCGFLAQQLQQIMNGGLGFRMAVDGRFSPEQFYRGMPSKTRMEPLPLGSSGAIAAGGTFTYQAIVQKPFKGTKLSFVGDTGSFIITNITAAGQTVTAAGGSIPMGRYAVVDSWPNIALPALTAGATISIAVTNTSGAPATAVGVIDGETGEA